MMPQIHSIQAREILDSRGNPTIKTRVKLVNGLSAQASVPSGASTGVHEAVELRDNDPQRFHSKGVLKAVNNVNSVIAPQLMHQDVRNQAKLDQLMIDLDGTVNKARLGANAMLSVSLAIARAAALAQDIPLYHYLGHLSGIQKKDFLLPKPMMNVLNGGKHAVDSTDMQEYMIAPVGAPSVKEAVRWGSEVFHTLKKLLAQAHLATTVGDEGGFAPRFKTNEEPLDFMVKAVEATGYQLNRDFKIALDPAASEFFHHGNYHLKIQKQILSTNEIIKLYKNWVDRWPIFSIEDGLAEDDWQGFSQMTAEMGQQIQIVGDDLFVTNPTRLQRGIDLKAANAILIKPNQIGTLTETIATIHLAKTHGYSTIISHRSGETCDTFIADLAVGTAAGQIKTGSLSRSERIAKYNRLMEIELELEG